MLLDDDGSIWFRQSWLDTANRCGERGRLAVVKPEWNESENDAALIGTATHEAIERCLNGELETAEQVGQSAYHAALRICEEASQEGGVGIKWTKWSLPGQLGEHARRCANAWYQEVRPQIVPGGHTEVEFKVPLGTRRGRAYGITGTVDYVSPDGVLVDWKTASRKFYQREKQRAAIQPTVYAAAAVRGAFPVEFEYPVTFRYGVMVRGNEKATTQLLDVRRSNAHDQWLMDQIETYIDLADAMGVERHWPRNEDHYLCNESWCPWWAICKGARLSTAQDNWTA